MTKAPLTQISAYTHICSDGKGDEDYSGLMRREYQSKDMRTVEGQPYMHVAYYINLQKGKLDSRLKTRADAASSGIHCIDSISPCTWDKVAFSCAV